MKNNRLKKILSGVMAFSLSLSLMPMNIQAAQSNEYVDPADYWIEANGRTNEFDINATTTYETFYCPVCDMQTTSLVYRVPEYTRTGESAKLRNIGYSDGTFMDESGYGDINFGTPGIDGYYTGMHWTKSVCQTCGILNTVDGFYAYSRGKNIYGLNACDHNFFKDFDNTVYEQYNSTYHTTILKKGEYCQYCKGTQSRATEKRETHNYTEMVDAQLGNQRFYVACECEDCGHSTSEYVVAKSVVSSYYGIADGEPHTVTLSDLSDGGVNTSIRYGTSAGNCNKTSAPNYTQEGYYPVYYDITYSYSGEKMTESGVSYVWLLSDDSEEGMPSTKNEVHVHDFRYIESVRPTCEELGFERWQCSGCGSLEKRNYIQTTGHNYEEIVIREADCQQGGFVLNMCQSCGDFYTETTPTTAHNYEENRVSATCIKAGYTEHICTICGDEYITDLTNIVSHTYSSKVIEPSCDAKGYTSYICEVCNNMYTDEYTDETGHAWDEGRTVTASGCVSEGVIEHKCTNEGCKEKLVLATDANGHTPGAEANCTEPQICEVCETVLELPKGHKHTSSVVEPTCSAMGYTVYTCDCGDTYTADYTDKAEHSYESEATEPTCTAHGFTTYRCTECDDSYISDYTEKKAHDYVADITSPTCTAMGYTTYTCKDCSDSYVSDYTDVLEHNYNKETIEPTCTEHGYAIYTCPDCGKSYIGDYSENKEHTYSETVVPPTCTEMGYIIFKCNDCDDEYRGDYTDKIPHDYDRAVTEPTCTEHGFTTFSCKNCDDEYVGEYTEKKAHAYKSEVTEPTCTSIGYTTHICTDCGHTVKDSYTDKKAHDYESVVTEPTCLTMGFTVYTCKSCGHTYKADYTEARGHKLSDWIIDTPATIEAPGSKHIECTVCGETLQTAEIAQLIDKDNSDEDGNAEVGDYFIILTDKDSKPIFDSEITIDIDDKVTIKLPNGRLLDFENRTTITAFDAETREAVSDLQIFIYDLNNNAATGKTDGNGQLVVPNNQSSTGDDNGTIGGEDKEENKFTYVVTVTDKTNAVIPNCDISIGESNNIVVTLPDGTKPSREEPVIITVTEHNGIVQKDVTIIAIGMGDYIEKGITDMYGKVTLPITDEGYTDDDGKVNVEQINVIVNDETELIPDAFVKHNEDGSINVTLPENKSISYDNRITVTVLDSMGNPVKDRSVTVSDNAEKSYTAVTDENGKIIVPPVSEDISDKDGNAVVNGYNVLITDETKPIENAFVVAKDGEIFITLPEGVLIDINNRITATVTDKDNIPVKDMSVTFIDGVQNTETNLTDENGKATVPPTSIDITDINGYSEVDGYIVTVKDEAKAIEKAFVTHNAEIKNEDGTVKAPESISVVLPDSVVFDYANRISVTVLNKADSTPVKDMIITVNEAPQQNDGVVEDTENAEQEENAEAVLPKTITQITDEKGIAVFPPLSEDETDDSGNSEVTDKKEEEDKDTDGDGVTDTPGETVETKYVVAVNDTKGVITDAFVTVDNGKIYVKLPDTHTLTTSNQTTVTVTDKDGKAMQGVSVIITDKNNTSKSGTTNTSGKVTLPVKSSGGGGGSSSGGSSGGGGGSSLYSSVNVTVKDKDGMAVTTTKSVATDKVTLTLPNGYTLDDNNYTITVKDRNSKVKADYTVILKDKNKKQAEGKTDKNGVLTLPGKEHKAYIVGYPDGTFRPNGDMSRAEAAAIFARLISEEKGESITGKPSFTDVSSEEWYYSYIGYLEKYNVIEGYNDNTFKPEKKVTRAEFVAMAVRCYDVTNDVNKSGYNVNYTDINSSHWAYKDVAYAKHTGWLNGYADGTFKPDVNITRAEVVAVVNRATDRVADKEYINENYTKLNRFTDVKDSNFWGWADIHEASNTHTAVSGDDAETWIK